MLPTWQLLNVDKQAVAETMHGPLDKLLLRSTPNEDLGGHAALLNNLRTPCLPKEADAWLTHGSTARQRGPLGWLPVEVLDLVFDRLKMHDIVMLAITCKALLAVAKPHILFVLTALHAPWQNCRLILLAADTPTRERLPAGLLSDAEWQAIVTGLPRLASPGRELPAHCMGLNYWGPAKYQPALGRKDVFLWLRRNGPERPPRLYDYRSVLQMQSVSTPFGVPAKPQPKLGPNDLRMFTVLWGNMGATYPEGTLVLCNMSKGEYIREDTLTVARDTDATLAHAFLARIAWSTNWSMIVDCSQWAKEELKRGSWAGDRFCVVTMDTLPVLGPGIGPWRDVTGGVDRLLRHLKDAVVAAAAGVLKRFMYS